MSPVSEGWLTWSVDPCVGMNRSALAGQLFAQRSLALQCEQLKGPVL